MEPIGKQFNNSQSPIDSSSSNLLKQLPIAVVDSIADSLVKEFHNPEYRRWYCGVIYEFRPARVHEWRRRASEGKEPAKLFSTYVKQARTYRQNSGIRDE